MSYRIGDRARLWPRAAALLVFGAVLANSAASVESTAPDAGASSPLIAYTRDAADLSPGGAADRLVQAARAQGRIRVIVGLRFATRMEHALSPREVEAQRGALRRVEDAVVERALGSAGAPDVTRFEFIPFIAISADAAALHRLLADPQVASVQKQLVLDPALAESLPLINADEVFARRVNGTGHVVAVLDVGFAFSKADPRKTHPMLAGKVVSEACYSTTDPAEGATSLCPDGVAESTAGGAGLNCPVDEVAGCDHGTHVASIAAGNSARLDGVARDAKIIAIKVASKFAGAGCGGPAFCARVVEEDLILGLKRVHALRKRFRIAAVNMSVAVRGGLRAAVCDDEFSALAAALKSLREAGIAPIKSTGNEGSDNAVTIPACISTVIAVGNTVKNDLIFASSNHSPLVKLMAPGTNIKAAVPRGSDCIRNGDPYCVKTGTSAAAPHVAGAFALLRSAKPTASVDAILEALTCSGKTVHERLIPGGFPVELDPARPRIDLIGAYNFLRKPPNALRRWNFAKTSEAADWTPFNSLAFIQGGHYVLGLKQNLSGSAVAHCGGAFQVVARLRPVEPPPIRSTFYRGVMVKATLDFKNETASGYAILYTRTFGSGRKTNGLIQVLRAESTGFNTSFKGTNICAPKNLDINLNGYDTVRIISRGALHTFYHNERKICTVSDATYSSGHVAIVGYTSGPVEPRRVEVDFLQVQPLGTAGAETAGDTLIDPAAFEAAHAQRRGTPLVE